ncbi:MAG: hypothetical protein IJC99_03955 [Clostridia bacterium]|nr:hypothetical protein [Clostridia bacterium]
MGKERKQAKMPQNGAQTSAFGIATLGDFKPDEIGRGENNIALGNFESKNKKQDDRS